PGEVAVVAAAHGTGRIAGEAVRRGRVSLRIAADPLDHARGGETCARSGDAAAAEAERDRSGEVRRRHAGAGDRVVAAVQPGRVSAHTRSGASVALRARRDRVVRERAIGVVGLTGATCRPRTRAATDAVAVG